MPSYHDLKVGETLDLAGNGQVRVTLVAKSGRRARLAIEADAAVAIRPIRAVGGSDLGQEKPGTEKDERPVFGWTEDQWCEMWKIRKAD